MTSGYRKNMTYFSKEDEKPIEQIQLPQMNTIIFSSSGRSRRFDSDSWKEGHQAYLHKVAPERKSAFIYMRLKKAEDEG